jgi:hypothetical protein
MIIEFEGYLCHKLFDTHVLPLMKTTNTQFSYFREEFQALVILEKQPLFFVFLTYIPNGHITHLPTLEQSMNNEKGETRDSTGEWVVDTIFQTREADAKAIFTKLEQQPKENKTIPFIRTELCRF